MWSWLAAVRHRESITVSGSNKSSGNKSVLDEACKLIGADSSVLEKFLTQKLIQIPRSDLNTQAHNKAQSVSMQDAEAMMLCCRIFNHVKVLWTTSKVVTMGPDSLRGQCRHNAMLQW